MLTQSLISSRFQRSPLGEDYKLPIILWSWGGKFSDDYISTVKSMLARTLHMPHRIVVISDSKKTRERFHQEGDQTIPLWRELSESGGKCFVRLKVFTKEFEQIIGPRFAWLDLDMVCVDDVTPIFARTEPFLMSGVELRPQPVNGSLVIMDAGVAPEIFTEFNVNEWRNKKAELRYGGSDQAWIAIKALDKITPINREDGLFCYRDDICPRTLWAYESWRARNLVNELKHKETGGACPKGARMIQCNGPHSPWSERTRRLSPWILQHFR